MLCPFIIFDIYIFILCSKKCHKHVKIISITDQKQNEFFCEDENVQFSFIGTKIKIRYIYRDEKTYLTLFNISIKKFIS